LGKGGQELARNTQRYWIFADEATNVRTECWTSPFNLWGPLQKDHKEVTEVLKQQTDWTKRDQGDIMTTENFIHASL